MRAGNKGDREMMPPPPADYLTKTRARSRSDSPEKARSEVKRVKGDVITYGKGKGREVESDDDEIELLGSSPGKPKKGDGESAIASRIWLMSRIRGDVDRALCAADDRMLPKILKKEVKTDPQAELAPGKARVAKVKAWIHEAIYGYPLDAIQNKSVGTDKIRKYKVCSMQLIS
jgi:cell cycle checkpoint protein